MTTEETTTDITINNGLEPPVILPPPIITMSDILSSVEVVTQKEQVDKTTLESIGNMGFDDLKSKLLVWGTLGFPNVYEIYKVVISPPSICSDGVTRDLTSYIQFCSGKSIHEHVAILQQRVQDMAISFANMGSYVAILVSRA